MRGRDARRGTPGRPASRWSMKSLQSLRAVVLALLAVLAPLALLASLVLAACSAPAPEPPADGAGPAPDLAQGDGAPDRGAGPERRDRALPAARQSRRRNHLGAGATGFDGKPLLPRALLGRARRCSATCPRTPCTTRCASSRCASISAIAPRTGPVPPRRTGGCGWCCSRSRPRARRTGRCTCSTPSPGSASVGQHGRAAARPGAAPGRGGERAAAGEPRAVRRRARLRRGPARPGARPRQRATLMRMTFFRRTSARQLQWVFGGFVRRGANFVAMSVPGAGIAEQTVNLPIGGGGRVSYVVTPLAAAPEDLATVLEQGALPGRRAGGAGSGPAGAAARAEPAHPHRRDGAVRLVPRLHLPPRAAGAAPPLRRGARRGALHLHLRPHADRAGAAQPGLAAGPRLARPGADDLPARGQRFRPGARGNRRPLPAGPPARLSPPLAPPRGQGCAPLRGGGRQRLRAGSFCQQVLRAGQRRGGGGASGRP